MDPRAPRPRQLRRRARADDDRGYSRLRGGPCQRHVGHRHALRLGEPRDAIDRREHLRIPVRLSLSFSGGKVRGEGTVLDLSMGGCIIKSQTQVHTNDIFYLQLSLEDSELPLEVAAMVHSVSARGIACKFLRAAHESKRLLSFVQTQVPNQPDKSSGKMSAAA
jgi:hypothetical protein